MNYPSTSDPQYPKTTAPVPYKISPEDQKIFKECNKEAFFTRCLPFAVGFGGVTILAVRAGHLKPHATWGATPKTIGAILFGYIFGKISYQQKCAEKFMAVPTSQVGAMLRARRQQGGRGGVFQDTLTLEMPGYLEMPEESSRDVYQDDISPRTFTDLDTDRPYNQGLNDSFRLNVDSPQRPEDFILPPQATTPNSYEEMRRKNREEFEKKSRPFRPQYEEPSRQYQSPQPPPSAGPVPLDRYKPTNVYGDIFEN